MKISIKVKFTLLLAAFLIVMVLLLSYGVLTEIGREQRNQYEAFLEQQSNIANLRAQQTYLSGNYPDMATFMALRGRVLALDLSQLIGLPVHLYGAEGGLVGSSVPSDGATVAQDVLKFALQGKIAYQTVDSTVNYFAPLRHVDGELIGIVRMDYSLQTYRDFYDRIRGRFGVIGIVVCLLGFTVGFIYFHRFAANILKLKKAAANIQAGRFLSKPPLKRKDELGELSSGIWFMSNAISQNLKTQKEFLGNITHEFKTPLTSIKAYADLLDMYADDPKLLTEAKTNIGKETGRLQEMVEKVLHLASLDKYEFEKNAERIEVKEALEDICGRMKGRIDRSGLALHDRLETGFILADRESFIHIFMNLLDNAIKYNEPNGSIEVVSESVKNRVRITVKNTGEAIPWEYQAKIFEPFFTVSGDRARQTGGSGLGLPLVKRLVEEQNGTIDVNSSKAFGTAFIVTFPAYRN